MRTFVQILRDADFNVEPYVGPGGEQCASFRHYGTPGNVFTGTVECILEESSVAPSPKDLETVAKAFRGMRTAPADRWTIVYFPGIAAE